LLATAAYAQHQAIDERDKERGKRQKKGKAREEKEEDTDS
jgi:hypothetical protein